MNKEAYLKLVPMGRMGEPEDVVGPILFLLFAAARYLEADPRGPNVEPDSAGNVYEAFGVEVRMSATEEKIKKKNAAILPRRFR